MSEIHRITHPTPHVQTKVNFFADYFSYMVEYMGLDEDLPLENPLSIVEKVIFQIETNFNNSVQYLENYLANPIILNHDFMKEFSKYSVIHPLIQEFNSLKKNKLAWLQNNPNFLPILKELQLELKSEMFKKSLEAIISYLKCECEVKIHENDIKLHTQILVSELFFSGRDRKELHKTFDRIISNEIRLFPFPKEIKGKKEKKKFIEQRTFKQQFEAIYHLLNRDKSSNIFLFRINGLVTKKDFKFKYNRVTFIDSNHSRFDKIKSDSENKFFIDRFFTSSNFIVGYVKVHFNTTELGRQEAVKIIQDELKYLKIMTEGNLTLDPFSYLVTKNFKSFGGSRHRKSIGVDIDKFNLSQFNNNPYRFLAKYKSQCVEHVLKCEPLFIAASESGRISDYWQYIEVLIPKDKKNGKQIKDIVPTALLLNYISTNEFRIRAYLLSVFNPFFIDPEWLGMTKKQMDHYWEFKNIKLDKISKQISHPFINHTLNNFKNKKQKDYYEKVQKYYCSIITEAYEIRNSDTHQWNINEKSALKIYYTLPKLINRLRWIIFEEIRSNNPNTFEELVDHVYQRGINLKKT